MDGENPVLVTAQNSLRLLKLFNFRTPELGVCEISHLTGFSKSTVSRMVTTFMEESILEKNMQNGKYRLSPVMLETGLVAEETDPVIQSSRTLLDRLHLETGCDASLYVREGKEAVCLYVSGNGDEVRSGQRVDLPLCVSGRAMFTYLEDEGQEGFASGIEPLDETLYTVSCPIFNHHGDVVAAVSITTDRSKQGKCESFLSTLGKTAQQLCKIF